MSFHGYELSAVFPFLVEGLHMCESPLEQLAFWSVSDLAFLRLCSFCTPCTIERWNEFDPLIYEDRAALYALFFFSF